MCNKLYGLIPQTYCKQKKLNRKSTCCRFHVYTAQKEIKLINRFNKKNQVQ